ncbi:EpsG family protein [uncultured Ruminococcus sp.]|uniref:EpsG family protein n=1 Tax=uncultured Ruminococcus sp. TaxID=165186 RepID=UPI0025CE5A15|nr:EpsG family protein [uncultured Ruminococcus sp.]
MYIGLFFLFYVFAAFRSLEVGNDTQEYYRIFRLISDQQSLTTALTVSRYEAGYIIYNYIVSRVTTNFQWILAINSGVYIGASIWFVNKYSTSFKKAIILFFSFGMYYNVMNIERQCIAIAFFLIAIPFLERKQYIRYVLLIMLASTFHMMSIVLLALVIIPKIDFTKKGDIFKWSVVAIVFLVALNYGVNGLKGYFPYLSHYLTDSMYSEGGVRIASIALCGIRIISVGLLLLVNGGGLSNTRENETDTDTANVFNKILLLDCVISIATIGFNMYDRIEKYVCIGFIVAIVNAIEAVSDRSNRSIIYGIVFIMSFGYLTVSLIYRPEWSGIFPFSFYNY